LRQGGFTLVECIVALSIMALVLMMLAAWQHTASIIWYRNANEVDAEQQIEDLFSAAAMQIHDVKTVLFCWGDETEFVLGDGTYINYHLNAHGEVIREVNGNGGEVIATGIRRLSFQLSADERTISIFAISKQGKMVEQHTITIRRRLS